ncbi:MAG: hypothetical protein JJ863_04860 [Deltaproteobacteria bacterium]|nr:hypothetical protein [Deltaproteobacteria bacterium]
MTWNDSGRIGPLAPLALAFAFLLVSCGDDGGPSTGDAAVVCSSDDECSDGQFCNGIEVCSPDSPLASSAGCVAGPPPCEADECVETSDSCDVPCDVPDADGDGHDSLACGGDDCDDEDASRFPGNIEVCDSEGVDEDCNPDTLGVDEDSDGSVSMECCNLHSSGTLVCGTDCNDRSASVGPDAPELCDPAGEVDENCNGEINEGVTVRCWEDPDGDGFAAADASSFSDCSCPAGSTSREPIGLSTTDCAEGDPNSSPARAELCDAAGVGDENCDGRINEGCDCGADEMRSCADGGYQGVCAETGQQTCTAEGLWGACSVAPAATDLCDGSDDDCDGSTDEGHLDTDADGMANCVDDDDDNDGAADGDDCRPLDPTSYPGAPEVCDPISHDCDLDADEGFVDLDGDGDADCNDTDDDDDGVADTLDCAPTDPSRFPLNPEVCDGLEQDCDLGIDEDFDFDTDPSHCGGCNMSCTYENATDLCVARMCTLGPCETGFADADGVAGNGCECAIVSTTDVPDDAFIDANCDGIDGDVAGAVFVSSTAPAGGDGSPASPLQTIEAGIALASGTGADVYVANGFYTRSTPLALASGVSIYGGYTAGSWQRGASTTTITVSAGVGLEGTDADDVTIDAVRVIVTGERDGSAYGVLLMDSSGVELRNTAIEVGPGAAGTHATVTATPAGNGTKGNDGGTGCEVGGFTCDDCSPPVGAFSVTSVMCNNSVTRSGRGGSSGAPGSSGGPGQMGASSMTGGGAPGLGVPPGFASSTPSGAYIGGPGQVGAGGAAGAAGSWLFEEGGYLPQPGGVGGDGGDGRGGGGGGGGGGHADGAFDCDSVGGSGGSGGSGGCGGVGGLGGGSGGASIGVFLRRSTLTVEGTVVTTVGGGDGGDGAPGQPGGTGGLGGDPSGYDASMEQASRGAGGGPGGDGGNGGPGGGGAGGASVGVFVGTASSFTQVGSSITPGAAGGGGSSIGNPGPTGVRQAVLDE